MVTVFTMVYIDVTISLQVNKKHCLCIRIYQQLSPNSPDICVYLSFNFASMDIFKNFCQTSKMSQPFTSINQHQSRTGGNTELPGMQTKQQKRFTLNHYMHRGKSINKQMLKLILPTSKRGDKLVNIFCNL